MRVVLHALSGLCAAALASDAWAEEPVNSVDYDPCNRDTAAFERLVGTYEGSYSPFRVTFGGMANYRGSGGKVDVALDYLGDDTFLLDLSKLNELIDGAEIPNMKLAFTGPDEPDWRFSYDPKLSSLTQEEFELTIPGNCGLSDVPRLFGLMAGTAGDLTVTHWVRLAMIRDGRLFGAYGWDAEEGNLRGRLQLTRQSMDTTLD